MQIFTSNISIMASIGVRISLNILLTQDWMDKALDDSYANDTWF